MTPTLPEEEPLSGRVSVTALAGDAGSSNRLSGSLHVLFTPMNWRVWENRGLDSPWRTFWDRNLEGKTLKISVITLRYAMSDEELHAGWSLFNPLTVEYSTLLSGCMYGSHTRTRTRTHTHTRTHARTRARAHTHTHTHTSRTRF